MDTKSPADFANYDEWISYVRENVPAAEQSYTLASGRAELFKSFYQVRQRTFPVEFVHQLERLQTLREPERTNELQSLNQRIFANLTEFLFDLVRSKAAVADAVIPASSSTRTQHLLDHLTEKNPSFALWTAYKNIMKANFDAQAWEDYLREELGPERSEDVAFTGAMGELDGLLLYFRDRNLPLPRYFFERCCFLHSLRGPERMLQTRSLLNTLVAEIEVCASA
jgi:hypothetical protein